MLSPTPVLWAKQHPLILQVSLLWQMFPIQALFGPEHGLPEQCLFTSRSFLRNPKSTEHPARLPSTQAKKIGLKFCLKSECCSGTGHLQLWQEATDARAVEKLRHQSRFSKVKMESSHSVDSVGQRCCAHNTIAQLVSTILYVIVFIVLCQR